MLLQLRLRCLFLCLTIHFALAATAFFKPFNVSYDHRALIIDGRRRMLVSAGIHYPRATPESKEGGADVIQTYAFWSGHEPQRGQVDVIQGGCDPGQRPPGLDTALNKGKIYISKSSPECVFEAYSQQFQKDFSVFLKSRAEEIVSGGRLVLSFMGRRCSDPTTEEGCYLQWELLAQALMTFVLESATSKIDCTGSK